MTTSTPLAAISSAVWARPAGCATAFPRRTAARCRSSIPVRYASRARRSRTPTGSPTSRSRCRASAAARSRSRATPRSGRAGFRESPRATRSPRSRCRSRDAGSDVGAMTTRARRDGDAWVLDGTKTWISNGGIADFYCVFARDPATTGTRGISAFVVPAGTAGAAHRRAHRRDRAASARADRIPCVSSRRRTRCSAPRATGSSSRCARWTSSARRSPPPRSGFARRAQDEAVAHARDADDVRRPAGRPAAHAGDAGRHGDRDRRGGAAHVPRRVAARRAGAARDARGGDGEDDRDRVCAARDRLARSSSSAAAASPAARSSSGSTARSARCASMKARPRCRS